jgi:hypothetical protein
MTSVTIVVPTFDRAGYVETAIDSVLRQDHPDLELIVLDDGSQDATPEVLARIAERAPAGRFRWTRHANVGQSETINRGFAMARGELLGYLSSDDYLLPGAISRLVAAAEAEPEAEVVYPGWRIVDGADRVLDTITPAQHDFADALRWGLCVPGVGALVRRRLYERIGGWDPRYRTCPDWEWWLRARDARFVRVPEILGAWRAHPGATSIAHDPLEGLQERITLLEELFADPELPAAVRAARNEAYAATLILQALTIEGRELGTAGRRFAVEDRIGPLFSDRGRREVEADRLRLSQARRTADAALDATRRAAEERRLANAVLQQTLDQARERIAQLEAELAARPPAAPAPDPTAPAPTSSAVTAPAERPPWLRVGRRLTPARLRHPLGVLVHRVRAAVR